jgi:hypothetical protein
MRRRIRHWLRLPLLTRRERRNLNGFLFLSISDIGKVESIDEKLLRCDLVDEFDTAITWMEGLQA